MQPPRPKLARSGFPLVTAVLAFALVAVFLGFQRGAPTVSVTRAIEFRCNAIEYGLIPYELTHPRTPLTDPYCQPQPGAAEDEHAHPRSDPGLTADAPAWATVVTSAFMHGSFLQLVASVLFLAFLGPPLERRLGRIRFLALYLLAGLAATATLIALAPNLPIVTLGATGSVAGVIGALVALEPRSRQTWFELPAGALLGVWLTAQLWLAGADAGQPVAGEGGDIAYLAPIGGLAAGVLWAAAVHARRRSGGGAGLDRHVDRLGREHVLGDHHGRADRARMVSKLARHDAELARGERQ